MAILKLLYLFPCEKRPVMVCSGFYRDKTIWDMLHDKLGIHRMSSKRVCWQLTLLSLAQV